MPLGLLGVVSTLSAGLAAGSLASVTPRRTWVWVLGGKFGLVPLGALTLLDLPPTGANGLLLAAAIPGGSGGPLVAAIARREPGRRRRRSSPCWRWSPAR